MIVYSTNVYLKFKIHQRFCNDTHYAWCSEQFDTAVLGRYQQGSGVPPTSNPASIYRDLKEAVQKHDRHNAKVQEQKTSLKALAVKWENNRQITTEEKEEIIYMVDNSDITEWRPLIYLIPRQPVANRLKTVPIENRASNEVEYIIEDLKSAEFHIIEP